MPERAQAGRAVFLDRDGTIVEDSPPGFLHEPARVRLLPGAGPAIRRLNEGGWTVVTVSNQSGIARGLYDAAAYEAVQRRLTQLLAAQHARVDAAYFCPTIRKSPDRASAASPACSCFGTRPPPSPSTWHRATGWGIA